MTWKLHPYLLSFLIALLFVKIVFGINNEDWDNVALIVLTLMFVGLYMYTERLLRKAIDRYLQTGQNYFELLEKYEKLLEETEENGKDI